MDGAVRTLLFPLHLLLDQRLRGEVDRSLMRGSFQIILLFIRYTEPLSFFIDKDMHGIDYAQQERERKYEMLAEGMEWLQHETDIYWEKKNN
jgi:hypothetical protein